METLIALTLQAGKDALNVSLYILLPIMVVMMILVKIMEVTGLLAKLTRWLAPITRPFGLSGLGVLAMIQISFISFVAPLPTLKLMEEQGVSDRELAASFAAVLAMAPANALFPLAVYGLNIERALLYSFIGGLVAAALTYWVFGKSLNTQTVFNASKSATTAEKFSLLRIINGSGRNAIEIVINIIPMLLVSLLVVQIFQQVGLVSTLQTLLSPTLKSIGIDKQLVLPSLTKYLAGSTALVGVIQQMADKHQLTPIILNLSSTGFLLHPVDLPGIAILMGAGKRLPKLSLPAISGAVVAILLRTGLGFAG